MPFEILKGSAELRQSLLQVVGQHRRPDQVRCGAVVMGTRRLRAKIGPVVKITVAATEPGEGNEVDLLVDIQISNKPGELPPIGILVPPRNPASHIVVAKIGGKLRS